MARTEFTPRADSVLAGIAGLAFLACMGLPLPRFAFPSSLLDAAICGLFALWSWIVAWRAWKAPTDLWRARAGLMGFVGIIAIGLTWIQIDTITSFGALLWVLLLYAALFHGSHPASVSALFRRGFETLFICFFMSLALIIGMLLFLISVVWTDRVEYSHLAVACAFLAAAWLLLLTAMGIQKRNPLAINVGAALFSILAASGVPMAVRDRSAFPSHFFASMHCLIALVTAFLAYHFVIVRDDAALGRMGAALRSLIRSIRRT